MRPRSWLPNLLPLPRPTSLGAVACAVLAPVVLGAGVVARMPIQDRPGQSDRAVIATGARVYATNCAPCHGANGDLVTGVDLRRGQFKTVSSDEDLQRFFTTGRPAAGMPAFNTLVPREVAGVIAFIRAGFGPDASSVPLGDPARGQALFTGRGGCAACHRINGRGPRVASDLSDIGAIRTAGSLQRALLDPTGSLMPANRSVRAVARDGRTILGRRLNEDTYTIQLIDEQERLVSLTKADLQSYEVSATSAMPSYKTTLTGGEISDVVAYLLSLKGTP